VALAIGVALYTVNWSTIRQRIFARGAPGVT